MYVSATIFEFVSIHNAFKISYIFIDTSRPESEHINCSYYSHQLDLMLKRAILSTPCYCFYFTYYLVYFQTKKEHLACFHAAFLHKFLTF